jgi:hypothetical protein
MRQNGLGHKNRAEGIGVEDLSYESGVHFAERAVGADAGAIDGSVANFS